jgi:NADH dehydrogenase
MRKKILVIGAGFGGLSLVKKLLLLEQVEIDIIDRNNYHLFQPLLYQVATSALSPADIAYPIRSIFRSAPNVQVFLNNVVNIDLEKSVVEFESGKLSYDYLIVAVGAKQSYFGNDSWQKFAPSLKTIEDALEIRRRILLSFEVAEYESDPVARAASLTFVIVGGGPTGVELAGAIREIAIETLKSDFRNIDTSQTRVVLIEGNQRVLKNMSEKSSLAAQAHLKSLGIEIRLNTRVTDVSADYVKIGDEFIFCKNIFWAAGVQASSLCQKAGLQCDKAGRALVTSDLSVPGSPNVFVIGDACSVFDPDSGEAVPGVAQAAIQAGEFVAEIIKSEVLGIGNYVREQFRYQDKGTMATIGRALAVAEVGNFKFRGLIAWMLWSLVHVLVLVGFKNRLSVLLNWLWNYLAFSRGARIITGRPDLGLKKFKDKF